MPNSILHISTASAIGAYTTSGPKIDGVIGLEWLEKGAESKNIDLDGGHTGKIYVMNDVKNLYMALEIVDSTPGQDQVRIYFYDGCGVGADDAAHFDQITNQYSDLVANPWQKDAQQDGKMSSTSGSGKNYFEFSKPLDTKDSDDFTYGCSYWHPGKFKFIIYYLETNAPKWFTGQWETLHLKSPWKVTIQDVRHPDQVKVGQKTFITVDVKCELVTPAKPLPLEILCNGKDFKKTVSNNCTITHTFELTAPTTPKTWSLQIIARPTVGTPVWSGSEKTISIKVETDLGITPAVEGICIWKGPPPPETARPSKQIEIPIKVKYAVTYDAWIKVGVYDENGGLLPSTVKFDEKVSGAGINKYIFKATAPATEGPWKLKASLYYGHVVGVDSIHKSCDEWPFTITVTSGVPGGGVKIIDVNSPTQVNSGAEVKVDVKVEYDLPAGAKYRVNILNATSSAVIKTSGEETVASQGFKTFSLDKIYAPIVPKNTTIKLLATAQYRIDGGWKILDPQGKKEFQIKVIAAKTPPGRPGSPPTGSPSPWAPIPPSASPKGPVSPKAPADFHFNLTVTPTAQEAAPGESVKYQVKVTGAGNQTQLVTLGHSGYPLGATSSMKPPIGTPTYTSNLNITLGGSVQPGTYNLNVSAFGGGKTHSQAVSLTVKSPPDFAISLSQQEVRVVRGQSASLGATVEPLHGFNTPVNLNAKDTPTGMTVNLNPTSGTPGFTSNIDIKVDSSVAAGAYLLTVTAMGSGEKTAQVILSVEVPRKPAPDVQPSFPYGLLAIIIVSMLLASLVFIKRRGKPKPAAPVAPDRFCIDCGQKIPPDVTHCLKCGAKQK